jgi:hypothetical protein
VAGHKLARSDSDSGGEKGIFLFFAYIHNDSGNNLMSTTVLVTRNKVAGDKSWPPLHALIVLLEEHWFYAWKFAVFGKPRDALFVDTRD